MGRYQRVLDLYEEDIRPAVVAHMITSLNDSAALLWRWYMYSGSTPPVPPEEVRDLAAPAAVRPGPAFRDTHAALAFAVAGDEADIGQMIDRNCPPGLAEGAFAYRAHTPRLALYKDLWRMVQVVAPLAWRKDLSHVGTCYGMQRQGKQPNQVTQWKKCALFFLFLFL